MNCGAGEDSWESLGWQGDQTSQSLMKSVLNIHWKDWCWGWNSNTLATWWEKLTHWKRPWCWEMLKTRGERDDRGWDGWMASLTRLEMSLSKLWKMIDRKARRAAIHGVTKSRTRLRDRTELTLIHVGRHSFHYCFILWLLFQQVHYTFYWVLSWIFTL